MIEEKRGGGGRNEKNYLQKSRLSDYYKLVNIIKGHIESTLIKFQRVLYKLNNIT